VQLKALEYLCCPACHHELRLEIENRVEAEVTAGRLECAGCERGFEIRDGLPNFLCPEVLTEPDRDNQRWHDQHAQEFDRGNRRWALRLGIWELGLWETRSRRKVIDKLELKKEDAVLETGVGTGINLPMMARQVGPQGRLDGMDISVEMLKMARRKMKAHAIPVELVQANASYLPYQTAQFEAVLHVGALNQFGDQKRAMEEMHRVAKPGAKIVLCDEGLAPGREKTWLGRRILQRELTLFAAQPPVDLLPPGAEEVKTYWVWQGTHWVIEYRKGNG